MNTFTPAFNKAVDHAMIYEVGGFWNLTPEVESGLISTPAQKRAVGYVNDPHDLGGETKFGVAKNSNPDLNITTLTWTQAKQVYFDRYWIPAKCEQFSDRLSVLLFDIAVNHGVKRSAIFLQRALGVADDGAIGPITLAKGQAADQIDLCGKICDAREQYYRDIVANKPDQSRFLKGWLSRSSDLRKLTTDASITF